MSIPLQEQIQYISNLYDNEITVSDLEKCRAEIIYILYDYLKKLEDTTTFTPEEIAERKNNMKEQLKQVIKEDNGPVSTNQSQKENLTVDEQILTFDEQINFISELYNNEITVSDLKIVNETLINVVYEYLISLIKNKSREREFIDKKKEEMKKKIQDVITDTKIKKEYEYVFEKNKKEINDLFLDLFYDSFLLFKKGWSGLTEDQKKQKDYFRYLEEKLNSVDGIASNTNDNGLEFKKLKDLNESQKDKMRPIINNSFIVGDDDFVALVAPAVYEDTFEFDSYRRFYY
jgi:hypothetical protein